MPVLILRQCHTDPEMSLGLQTQKSCGLGTLLVQISIVIFFIMTVVINFINFMVKTYLLKYTHTKHTWTAMSVLIKK